MNSKYYWYAAIAGVLLGCFAVLIYFLFVK